MAPILGWGGSASGAGGGGAARTLASDRDRLSWRCPRLKLCSRSAVPPDQLVEASGEAQGEGGGVVVPLAAVLTRNCREKNAD